MVQVGPADDVRMGLVTTASCGTEECAFQPHSWVQGEERRGGEEAGVKLAHNDLAHCTHRTEPPPNSLKVGVQGDAELGSSSKCQEGSVQ